MRIFNAHSVQWQNPWTVYRPFYLNPFPTELLWAFWPSPTVRHRAQRNKQLKFCRVKLNIILMSIVRTYIAHGFQRMCCWCVKCYIVSISESTAVYVANHAAISRVFELVSSSSMYTENNIGWKNPPCFTPFVVEKYLDWELFHETFRHWWVYIYSRQRIINGLRPRSISW